MANVFTSMEALKAAMLKEVSAAVETTTDKSFELLQRNVDAFYNSPEGIYKRTGQLQASPQNYGTTITGNGAVGQIGISTGTQYWPAGRDTEWIYQVAEDGGLLGQGGFWKNTEAKVQNILDSEIQKRFG